MVLVNLSVKGNELMKPLLEVHVSGLKARVGSVGETKVLPGIRVLGVATLLLT